MHRKNVKPNLTPSAAAPEPAEIPANADAAVHMNAPGSAGSTPASGSANKGKTTAAQAQQPKAHLQLFNDEPVPDVGSDSLNRRCLVEQLVHAVEYCETPFVVAVNGGWGTGKTSVLKCLEQEIEKKESKRLRTVWFSPWKFQFEDSPSISLLQTIRSTAEEKNWIVLDKAKRKTSKLLDIVGSLAGEIVLKTVTGHAVSTRDIINQGAAFEEKYFEAKQLTSRMQEEYQKAIETLVEEDGRLVLFIDDLDRCNTENALRLLEALKLFLNAKSCVYVIAIDMANLARNLAADKKIAGPDSYLEKIFQLVYTLPPPSDECKRGMVEQLLKNDGQCSFAQPVMTRIKYDLGDFIADNPRALKHFCNRFRLESAMLQQLLAKEYQPLCHIFLQILQHCFPTVFGLFRTGKYHIMVHPGDRPGKRFDQFVQEWYYLFVNTPGHNDGSGTAAGNAEKREQIKSLLYISPEVFGKYFEYMPALGHRDPLEEPYRFVTATVPQLRKQVIVCIENHKRNAVIEMGGNLSEMEHLEGAMLRDLNLSGCLFYRCDLSRADLSRTNLSGADCSYSIFKEVIFTSGKACGTIFKCANLDGMSFDSADFSGTDFSVARNVPEALKNEQTKEGTA